jgi:hypothetical protein
MTSQTPNPAAANCGARETFVCMAALNEPENTPSYSQIQSRRAAWLARRFRLPTTIAHAVAALHFGEATHV